MLVTSPTCLYIDTLKGYRTPSATMALDCISTVDSTKALLNVISAIQYYCSRGCTRSHFTNMLIFTECFAIWLAVCSKQTKRNFSQHMSLIINTETIP